MLLKVVTQVSCFLDTLCRSASTATRRPSRSSVRVSSARWTTAPRPSMSPVPSSPESSWSQPIGRTWCPSPATNTNRPIRRCVAAIEGISMHTVILKLTLCLRRRSKQLARAVFRSGGHRQKQQWLVLSLHHHRHRHAETTTRSTLTTAPTVIMSSQRTCWWEYFFIIIANNYCQSWLPSCFGLEAHFHH